MSLTKIVQAAIFTAGMAVLSNEGTLQENIIRYDYLYRPEAVLSQTTREVLDSCYKQRYERIRNYKKI
ncbi:hypothetical protein JXM83_06730 [Candidatus Woesearchaeota archaeon]|nr:hypothetical protein [Candidatus Woesearchaeota archaeon]